LGRREKRKYLQMSEKITLFKIKDETILDYFLKIDSDRRIVSNLLFQDDSNTSVFNRNLLCEYFSILGSIESILEEVAADDIRDKEDETFYLTTETQAMQIKVFMEGIVQLKTLLLDKNISLYFH
jgi:hypothetical protein